MKKTVIFHKPCHTIIHIYQTYYLRIFGRLGAPPSQCSTPQGYPTKAQKYRNKKNAKIKELQKYKSIEIQKYKSREIQLRIFGRQRAMPPTARLSNLPSGQTASPSL